MTYHCTYTRIPFIYLFIFLLKLAKSLFWICYEYAATESLLCFSECNIGQFKTDQNNLILNILELKATQTLLNRGLDKHSVYSFITEHSWKLTTTGTINHLAICVTKLLGLSKILC